MIYRKMRGVSVILASILLLAFLSNALGEGEEDLVGYWRFDEGTGLIANDLSGHNNHGELKLGPIWTEGNFGTALEFDGINDYVVIQDAPSLDIGGHYITYMAWI